jgi:hypothetical protein
MPSHGDLGTLLRTARQLAKLFQQGAGLVEEAHEHHASEQVMAAARVMHSELLSTKHAVEDELVAFVVDCERCGRRVHWVPGHGCELGHWAHSEPAPEDHQPRLRS